MKCNYPGWPRAKDLQRHLRPGLAMNGDDLQLASLLKIGFSGGAEPPNSLLGPGVTHRKEAARPGDLAELAS